MIDRAFAQIPLTTIFQILVAALLKREGAFPHHFHLFHDKTS
jgi:hypothetical protein